MAVQQSTQIGECLLYECKRNTSKFMKHERNNNKFSTKERGLSYLFPSIVYQILSTLTRIVGMTTYK